MLRFFSSSRNISEDKIVISERSKIHHLKDVLHAKIGEKITIFDEKCNEYITEIEKVLNQNIILKIKEKRFIPTKGTKLTIACAIPKKSKMDDIIDKLTQLGADRIIPMLTERVIVKLDEHRKQLKEARWRKIGQSASEQSQQRAVPIIEPIQDIKEVLSRSKDFDLKLIPTLMGERKLLKEILSKAAAKKILVLIGPEGDFTDEEIELAKKAGCIPVTLGDLVLRVDTAAIAIASILNYALCTNYHKF